MQTKKEVDRILDTFDLAIHQINCMIRDEIDEKIITERNAGRFLNDIVFMGCGLTQVDRPCRYIVIQTVPVIHSKFYYLVKFLKRKMRKLRRRLK